MRKDDANPFDDPVLKSAVRKAYAGERASAELRRRVADLAAASSPAPLATPRLSLVQRNPLYGLAAAAILLLAIGAAISQYMGVFHSQTDTANTLPVAIVDAMTATHDHCAKLPDHHLLSVDFGDDMASIGQALQAELARPVLASQLGNGWNFRGAGICKVGRFQSGHLLFARGNQFVSLFSLPSVSYQIKGSGNYELLASGHPIAGFAAPRGLFCLVGSDPAGTLTTDELASLRDKVRDKITFTPPANVPATGGCPSMPAAPVPAMSAIGS